MEGVKMKHVKNPGASTRERGATGPVWPDASLLLELNTVGTSVEFGGDESFESLSMNRTDWEKLGAPLVLSVYLTKER